MADNPFAALSFLAGPALLLNASTVLLLGTINRFARGLDRVRSLGADLAKGADDAYTQDLRLGQIAIAERRVRLMVRTLSLFYSAIGAFGISTLAALVGATLVGPEDWLGTDVTRAIMLGGAVIGVAALVAGAALLGWESRMTMRILRLESTLIAHGIASRRAGMASTGRR
jgi:hypothetical protein